MSVTALWLTTLQMTGKNVPKTCLFLRSRSGSTSVFLCIILSSLIMLSFAMIWSVREHCVNSRIDAYMNLAGESLMSEFNREVFEGYGLFMIDCDPSDSGKKLRYYMGPGATGRDISLTDVGAGGGRFVIVDPGPIKDQIIAYMRSGGINKIAKIAKIAKIGKTGGSTNEAEDGDGRGYHNLNHGPTVVSLPSRGLAENSILSILGKTDRLKDISGAFTDGTEKFLIGSYVLGTFNDCRNRVNETHFFHNEVEYILCGKLKDEENEKAIIRTIRTLRMPSNLAHIYSDPAKASKLAAAAEAIAPGPAGLAVQAALGGAWAWAESSNDASLLLEGAKVPLVKDSATWALDLDSVISYLVKGALDPDKFLSSDEGQGSGHSSGSNYGDDPEKLLKNERPVIRPAENRGLDYEQYLRILLFLNDEPQTIMRILDLIQINMRKDHDGKFLICEQSTGISYESTINGRKFSYDKKY